MHLPASPALSAVAVAASSVVGRQRSSGWDSMRGAAWGIAWGVLVLGCPRNGSMPNGADPEKVSRAEYDLALDDWQHQRYRAAMEHAQKAVSADDNNAEAHRLIALLYLAICQAENDCRWEEAEKAARKAIAVDPELRPAKHLLAVILIQQKKYDEAIAILRPLAEDIVYKTPELAWYELGGAYLEKNEPDKALEVLEKALALKPGWCWVDYRMGVAFEKKGNLIKAEELLKRSVDRPDPICKRLQDAWEALGRVHEKLGQKPVALEEYKQCVSISDKTSIGKRCVDGVVRCAK